MMVSAVDNRLPPCPTDLSEADRFTWDLGDSFGEDRRWRERQFIKLPRSFQMPAARDYRKIHQRQGTRAANTYLRELAARFDAHDIRLATDEDAIKQYAKGRAADCDTIIRKARSELRAYVSIRKIINPLGFKPPTLRANTTLTGALLRLADPLWWRRQIRSHSKELFEGAAIHAGMVHARAGLYVSNESLNVYKLDCIRKLGLLKRMKAENEIGQSFTLDQLVETSIANPKNRRNELMARLNGFDQIADKQNHIGIFITITCPSRMHARYKKTGHINPAYDGTTPRKAQNYLCTLWSRIRAKLKNDNIPVYGFRVAEPQHDGTPHWHLLLYTDQINEKAIKDIFLDYALRDSPDEKGALKRRCTFEVIDRSKGSGVGYIAKYISKNIDGAHVDKDLHGNDAKNSALRVIAWSSIHKIRQFQQFGGPSVSCWRELRRLGGSTGTDLLCEAQAAADQGDFERYTNLAGGTQIKVKDQLVKLARQYVNLP